MMYPSDNLGSVAKGIKSLEKNEIKKIQNSEEINIEFEKMNQMFENSHKSLHQIKENMIGTIKNEDVQGSISCLVSNMIVHEEELSDFEFGYLTAFSDIIEPLIITHIYELEFKRLLMQCPESKIIAKILYKAYESEEYYLKNSEIQKRSGLTMKKVNETLGIMKLYNVIHISEIGKTKKNFVVSFVEKNKDVYTRWLELHKHWER